MVNLLITDGPGHHRHHAIDVAKARTELSHAPVHGFAQRFTVALASDLPNEAWRSAAVDDRYRDCAGMNR